MTLVADVGDVLINTVPGAHHRALAAVIGRPTAEVAHLVESAGLPEDFERGTVDPATFCARVRAVLGPPAVPDEVLAPAWNAVVGRPVTTLVDAVAPLARAGRLVLASTTNPWHWALVRHRLSAAGLPDAPAVLSFAIGTVKPEDAFYRALRAVVGDAGGAVFVDDREANVAAALRHGFTGWTHVDPRDTEERVRALAATG